MFHSKLLLLILLLLQANWLMAEDWKLSGRQLRATALRYERGQGIKQDFAKAFRLYCLASALGDRPSQYHLGWMYFNGRGLKRNQAIAMGWFRRAARGGDRYALRMAKRFKDIRPAKDPDCPVTADPKKMDKKTITAWAKILARELGVEAKLVLAVIKTESSFNATALSPKAAYGLMQLMPETAKRFSVNRMNPVENMIGGVLYLRWLLRHFQGDVKLALAAYNAGESAVHRYRGVPPFKETRLYVARILADYRRKRHPIPASPPI